MWKIISLGLGIAVALGCQHQLQNGRLASGSVAFLTERHSSGDIERGDRFNVTVLYTDRGCYPGKSVSVQKTWPPLFVASWFGHEGLVADLVDKGIAEGGSSDPKLGNPLCWEIQHGHTRNALALIEEGLFLETECIGISNRYLGTPLHFAAAAGNIVVVRALLKAGIPVDSTFADLRWESVSHRVSKGHMTPLHLAAWYGHLEVAKELVQAGADVNRTVSFLEENPLIFAIRSANVELIRYLVSVEGIGEPVTDKKYGIAITITASDALEAAIHTGDSDILEILLKANLPLPRRGSLLASAIYSKDMDALTLLLRHHPEFIRAEDDEYGGWLWHALVHGRVDLADQVMATRIAAGCKVLADCDGAALALAIQERRLSWIQHFSKLRMDFNKPVHMSRQHDSRKGMLPLRHAVKAGNKDALKALLAGGADPRRKGPSGETPIEAADRLGKTKLSEIMTNWESQKKASPAPVPPKNSTGNENDGSEAPGNDEL